MLGSGGPGAAGRAASSYVVLLDGIPRILVDAGSGAFARLGEAHVSPAKIDLVLLTHLHIDHASELPGLIKARAVSSGDPIKFDVWGPAGSNYADRGAYFPSTTRFVDLLFGKRGAFAYLRDFAAPITIQAHDIRILHGSQASAIIIIREGGLIVTAVGGHHGDAPAVIYRVGYGGKSITFSGDIDAKGLPALRNLALESDLLVFNCVVLDPPGSPPVLYGLHTPPHAIGQVARDAHVRHLLLSHLTPAVDRMRDEVLESVHQTYPGSVSFADDGAHVLP